MNLTEAQHLFNSKGYIPATKHKQLIEFYTKNSTLLNLNKFTTNSNDYDELNTLIKAKGLSDANDLLFKFKNYTTLNAKTTIDIYLLFKNDSQKRVVTMENYYWLLRKFKLEFFEKSVFEKDERFEQINELYLKELGDEVETPINKLLELLSIDNSVDHVFSRPVVLEEKGLASPIEEKTRIVDCLHKLVTKEKIKVESDMDNSRLIKNIVDLTINIIRFYNGRLAVLTDKLTANLILLITYLTRKDDGLISIVVKIANDTGHTYINKGIGHIKRYAVLAKLLKNEPDTNQVDECLLSIQFLASNASETFNEYALDFVLLFVQSYSLSVDHVVEIFKLITKIIKQSPNLISKYTEHEEKFKKSLLTKYEVFYPLGVVNLLELISVTPLSEAGKRFIERTRFRFKQYTNYRNKVTNLEVYVTNYEKQIIKLAPEMETVVTNTSVIYHMSTDLLHLGVSMFELYLNMYIANGKEYDKLTICIDFIRKSFYSNNPKIKLNNEILELLHTNSVNGIESVAKDNSGMSLVVRCLKLLQILYENKKETKIVGALSQACKNIIEGSDSIDNLAKNIMFDLCTLFLESKQNTNQTITTYSKFIHSLNLSNIKEDKDHITTIQRYFKINIMLMESCTAEYTKTHPETQAFHMHMHSLCLQLAYIKKFINNPKYIEATNCFLDYLCKYFSIPDESEYSFKKCSSNCDSFSDIFTNLLSVVDYSFHKDTLSLLFKALGAISKNEITIYRKIYFNPDMGMVIDLLLNEVDDFALNQSILKFLANLINYNFSTLEYLFQKPHTLIFAIQKLMKKCVKKDLKEFNSLIEILNLINLLKVVYQSSHTICIKEYFDSQNIRMFIKKLNERCISRINDLYNLDKRLGTNLYLPNVSLLKLIQTILFEIILCGAKSRNDSFNELAYEIITKKDFINLSRKFIFFTCGEKNSSESVVDVFRHYIFEFLPQKKSFKNIYWCDIFMEIMLMKIDVSLTLAKYCCQSIKQTLQIENNTVVGSLNSMVALIDLVISKRITNSISLINQLKEKIMEIIKLFLDKAFFYYDYLIHVEHHVLILACKVFELIDGSSNITKRMNILAVVFFMLDMVDLKIDKVGSNLSECNQDIAEVYKKIRDNIDYLINYSFVVKENFEKGHLDNEATLCMVYSGVVDSTLIIDYHLVSQKFITTSLENIFYKNIFEHYKEIFNRSKTDTDSTNINQTIYELSKFVKYFTVLFKCYQLKDTKILYLVLDLADETLEFYHKLLIKEVVDYSVYLLFTNIYLILNTLFSMDKLTLEYAHNKYFFTVDFCSTIVNPKNVNLEKVDASYLTFVNEYMEYVMITHKKLNNTTNVFNVIDCTMSMCRLYVYVDTVLGLSDSQSLLIFNIMHNMVMYLEINDCYCLKNILVKRTVEYTREQHSGIILMNALRSLAEDAIRSQNRRTLSELKLIKNLAVTLARMFTIVQDPRDSFPSDMISYVREEVKTMLATSNYSGFFDDVYEMLAK